MHVNPRKAHAAVVAAALATVGVGGLVTAPVAIADAAAPADTVATAQLKVEGPFTWQSPGAPTGSMFNGITVNDGTTTTCINAIDGYWGIVDWRYTVLTNYEVTAGKTYTVTGWTYNNCTGPSTNSSATVTPTDADIASGVVSVVIP
ncbi:hypothetical protein ACFYWX_24885 [Streptomyces sp. NPDC002888]|uniref:hypothetical protein n=1 Tax=Streptomyces sp. NPDC002888 TaxID=3364668 RepID=UPI00369BB7F1